MSEKTTTITFTCEPDIAQRLIALYDLLSVDTREAAFDFSASVSAVVASRAISLLRDKVREVYIDTGIESELDGTDLLEFVRLLNSPTISPSEFQRC